MDTLDILLFSVGSLFTSYFLFLAIRANCKSSNDIRNLINYKCKYSCKFRRNSVRDENNMIR
jgi:hypothetical protein